MQPSPNSPPRVALFSDTFSEANGVGTLTRHLTEFARNRNLPFLLVRGSGRTCLARDGSVETLEIKRGAASFPVDKSLYFDPLLTRHKQYVSEQLKAFRPDLLHITGPGDVGFLGLWMAYTLCIPMVASWHTNLHEYLSRRLHHALNLLPQKLRSFAASTAERVSLCGLLRFYQTAHFVLAPNQTLVDLLHSQTGRPAFLMPHGVDLNGYCPVNGTTGNHPFCIGYVGRLTTEKNVRFFPELERKLLLAGEQDYQFLIVGEGGQGRWLKNHLRNAEIPGVLRGSELARAYGRMDAFVFPSHTDTFGLVILEAMASGVPVIVAPETGARIGIQNGVSGLVSEDFATDVQRLMHDPPLRASMGSAARRFVANMSWDVVFEQLYRTYALGLAMEDDKRHMKEARQRRRLAQG